MRARLFSIMLLSLTLSSALLAQEPSDILEQPIRPTMDTGTVIKVQDPRLFWLLITRSSEPVLVIFSTRTCPTCELQKPFAEELARGEKGIRVIEIDAESAYDLAWRHGITAVPTNVVYVQGRICARRVAGQTAAGLQALVNEAVTRASVAGEKTPVLP